MCRRTVRDANWFVKFADSPRSERAAWVLAVIHYTISNSDVCDEEQIYSPINILAASRGLHRPTDDVYTLLFIGPFVLFGGEQLSRNKNKKIGCLQVENRALAFA